MKILTSTDRLNELFDSDPRNDTAIADDLGVSKQTVSAWRKGIRSPKKKMLVQISEAYNVSLEWLMGFDVSRLPLPDPVDEEKPHTIEAKILSRGIDKLPKEQREKALAMFKVMFAPQYADLFNRGDDNDT